MARDSLLDFSGRTVLVTGGSSGIGNGIARAFLEHGAEVHVTGTRAAAGDYGPGDGDLEGLAYHRLEIADFDAVETFDPRLERLDVLVNAVGTVIYKRGEFAMPGFRKVIDVNLNGPMAASVRFQPLLAQSGGSLILIGSGASFHAAKGNPAYSASKGGLLTLTKTLAEAWAGDGIRVNGIAPGFVDTKITKVTRDNEQRYQGTLAAIPLKRWGTPADMGHVALFLASPMAAYMTGQMLLVDGGMGLS